ncbi:NAD(P)/FAD-dependent oxidoreductase [Aliirhizobium smilacinae]|uniref:FAD-binding oxidoreductase n=1 Tax=Aliirhizobium smilacinae TaxID=1395944 RepID=A0A5C4XQY9_9HYPH|nr:FAD-binding oxidoreductase [Rhizobium smilacinae]TNM65371.1 FAD-binding oxidoreductase [Rhizobium smilacinae]
MNRFDVAIIGGGLAGCSAAFHLSKRGASVALLERGRCGAQASGVNFGGVRRQGRHPAELGIAQRSHALWKDLARLIGTDGEFRTTGHLKLARSPDEMADLEAYRETARTFDLELELLDTKSLRARYPYLGQAAQGGSFCPGDGQANPRIVAPAFSRAARALGATVLENTEVVHGRRDDGDFRLELASGQNIRARRLLNMAGAWGARIAAWFGDIVQEGVMAPNMCVTEPLPQFIGPALGVCGGDVYIRQVPQGSVIFGAGYGLADRDRVFARPLADVTAAGARLAVSIIPRLADALLVRTWTGIEGTMPDGIPVMGPSPSTEGLFHAFGFTGHGFQLGPAAGAVMAELALDGETPTEIGALAFTRFNRSSTATRTGC